MEIFVTLEYVDRSNLTDVNGKPLSFTDEDILAMLPDHPAFNAIGDYRVDGYFRNWVCAHFGTTVTAVRDKVTEIASDARVAKTRFQKFILKAREICLGSVEFKHAVDAAAEARESVRISDKAFKKVVTASGEMGPYAPAIYGKEYKFPIAPSALMDAAEAAAEMVGFEFDEAELKDLHTKFHMVDFGGFSGYDVYDVVNYVIDMAATLYILLHSKFRVLLVSEKSFSSSRAKAQDFDYIIKLTETEDSIEHQVLNEVEYAQLCATLPRFMPTDVGYIPGVYFASDEPYVKFAVIEPDFDNPDLSDFDPANWDMGEIVPCKRLRRVPDEGEEKEFVETFDVVRSANFPKNTPGFATGSMSSLRYDDEKRFTMPAEWHTHEDLRKADKWFSTGAYSTKAEAELANRADAELRKWLAKVAPQFAEDHDAIMEVIEPEVVDPDVEDADADVEYRKINIEFVGPNYDIVAFADDGEQITNPDFEVAVLDWTSKTLIGRKPIGQVILDRYHKDLVCGDVDRIATSGKFYGEFATDDADADFDDELSDVLSDYDVEDFDE